MNTSKKNRVGEQIAYEPKPVNDQLKPGTSKKKPVKRPESTGRRQCVRG